MESNVKQTECLNFRPKTEETRKRSASGRLSPRSLFGNLKIKKPFQEEDAVSRNLNNSKNTHGWKPPLKVDSNDVSNKVSDYDCEIENSGFSFPNHDSNLSQNQNFVVNEQNYSGSNENLYHAENDTEYPDFGESLPGNSNETLVERRELSNQNHLIKDEELDYSEEDIQHDLDNSEPLVKQESHEIQMDCRKNQEEGDIFQLQNEKLDFSNSNHDLVKRGFQDSNISPSPLRNEMHINNQNYDATEILSQATVKLEKNNLGMYVDRGTHFNDEDQEYSEKSDSSKSTIELGDSKKFPMKPNYEENNNYIDKENIEPYVTNGADDSFDQGVTNSQFLQLENQISKSSIGMNTNNFNNSKPLINNLEAMQRYCSSLVSQSEWQKNILKSITRDIDGLNKAIVNVTGALKSIRKDNTSGK